MDNPSRIVDFVLVAGGLIIVPIILVRICVVLNRGKIDRRHPYLPFTRAGDPWAFWGIVICSLIGALIITWGTVVHIRRLLAI